MAFASVKADDYAVILGKDEIRRVKSSSFGHRGFCARCGTPLYMRVDHQPDTCDFSIATLDEPGRIRPGFHIFWASHIHWLDFEDKLPKFDGFRPNTRGFEEGKLPA